MKMIKMLIFHFRLHKEITHLNKMNLQVRKHQLIKMMKILITLINFAMESNLYKNLLLKWKNKIKLTNKKDKHGHRILKMINMRK